MSYFHVLLYTQKHQLFLEKEAKSYYYKIHNLLSEFEFT